RFCCVHTGGARACQLPGHFGLGKPDCPQRELPGLAKGAELARSSVPVCGGRGVVL
ncbi:unnamed protein product, partial [Effrenium voratum]